MFIMAEFPLHIFDDSEFQMEFSARFPEILDLLEMREANQNKNT